MSKLISKIAETQSTVCEVRNGKNYWKEVPTDWIRLEMGVCVCVSIYAYKRANEDGLSLIASGGEKKTILNDDNDNVEQIYRDDAVRCVRSCLRMRIGLNALKTEPNERTTNDDFAERETYAPNVNLYVAPEQSYSVFRRLNAAVCRMSRLSSRENIFTLKMTSEFIRNNTPHRSHTHTRNCINIHIHSAVSAHSALTRLDSLLN